MANKSKLTDYSLPTDAYASFDALTLKQLIKERLDSTSFFTGQNYEGSNLSSMIDIIAYSYHVLLFYLNQTSTETLFSESELYENMNRIVKTLDYKPVGVQTSTLPFQAKATDSLLPNTYTIPRYTFLDTGGGFFSFKEDVTFTKTGDGTEVLTNFSNAHLLYQGKFEEYPVVAAVGEDFETITLIPGDDITIDHFNVHVYVKDTVGNRWEQWNRATSLFLHGSTDRKFEVRLNENKRYELKFGNNITGRRLSAGDQVAIYYLKSDRKAGEVGVGAIDNSSVIGYNTVQFTQVFNHIKDPHITYTSAKDLTFLALNNTNASSEFYEGETVEDIRERAPKIFSSQHRLVTKADYENHVKQAFSNFVRDVKVANNWDYLDGHFKYNIKTIGLDSANKDPRTLYNQVTFADSCDFNNVYVYAVPRVEKSTTTVIRTNYLTPAQKTAIISSLRENKTLTSEIVVMDPVYMAVDIGAYVPSEEELIADIKDRTELQIVRESGSTRSLESIQNAAHQLIADYFRTFTLGSVVNITQLVNDILNLEGVSTVYTVRTDRDIRVDGLNLLLWNPVYPNLDIQNTGSNVPLPIYKYPYLNDPVGFANKIKVVAEQTSTGYSEY